MSSPENNVDSPPEPPVDARFVIDDEQVVVEWGRSNGLLAGVGEARGRFCYEVVRGHDGAGTSVCGPHCQAKAALEAGQLVGEARFLAPRPDGDARACTCELTALPDGKGALARVYSTPGRSLGVADELAALGTLACSLHPCSVETTLDQGLDCLRRLTGADVAEAFLVEPDGAVTLTGYYGACPEAFFEVPRFAPSEGYPGLVVSRGQSVISQDLANDTRYRRTAVKQEGFQCYACVPLPGASGVVGSLHVAYRRPDADVARAASLLSWASRPIGAAISSAAGALQRAVADAPRTDIGVPTQAKAYADVAREMLARMIGASGACGGALNVVADARMRPIRLRHGISPQSRCRALVAGNCPVLQDPGTAVVRSASVRNCPPVCRNRVRPVPACYCVPVPVGNGMGAVAELFFHTEANEPPTRHLVGAAMAAEVAGHQLRKAWNAYRPQPAGSAKPLPGPGSDAHTGELSAQAGDDPPYLEARCFGAFEVFVRGKPVTADQVHRRKTLTLLQLLLYYDGQPVPKDTLIELLWPDAASSRKVNQLYVLVCELRRLIQPAGKAEGHGPIRTQGDRYYFEFEGGCHVDVRAFRRLVQQGKHLDNNGHPGQAIDAYEAAVALYRGDYLEEERFAEWCWQEREYLREHCLQVLRRLADLLAERGESDRVIQYLKRCVSLDPLREDNNRALMYALWKAGRRNEAVRLYGHLRRILRDELDVDPVPETEDLVHQIRQNTRP